jgi:hypothetical protein
MERFAAGGVILIGALLVTAAVTFVSMLIGGK